MFDWVEKYKFGILAALAVYIGLFMYFQMDTYTQYFEITPFHDGAVVQEEEIEVQKENIEVPQDFQSGEVKNMVSDVNDTRKKSYDDYSFNNNKSAADVEQSIKDLEKQFYNEAGGDKDRQKLQQQMKERENSATTQSQSNKKENPSSNGGDIAYKGKTMVDFYLKNRDPFQNNRWYLRNPGYTCGQEAGTVHVDVKVNKNGNVTSAVYNPSKSNGASSCMIEKALEYAKKSRFAYSSSAPDIQSGWIQYIFVSQ